MSEKTPKTPNQTIKALVSEQRHYLYRIAADKLDTSDRVELRTVIEDKSHEDLIVFLGGKYYYLTAKQLKKTAVEVVPDEDIEAQQADQLRKSGTLLAHMDEQPPIGEWTTLVNLDAVIAGAHAKSGEDTE